MDQKCRICRLKAPDLLHIVNDKSIKLNINILRLYEYLTGLDVTLINTFAYICMSCLIKLENAYEFKQLCINVEQEFITESLISTPKHNTYLCNICGKDFKTRRSLNNHLLSHSDTKQFACTYCDLKLGTRYSLKMHERIHTNLKPYICSYCGFKFRTSGHLLMHTRKHKQDLPYRCSVQGCNKAYPQSSELKVHIRSSHTGERNFQCDCCDKNFITKQHLKQHYERNHEPKPGTKDFDCPMCGKMFYYKRSVTKHLKNVHKVIRKNICDT